MSELDESLGKKFLVIGSDGKLLLQSLGATITSIQPVDDNRQTIQSFGNSNSDFLNPCENIDTSNSNLLSNSLFQDIVSCKEDAIISDFTANLKTLHTNKNDPVTLTNNLQNITIPIQNFNTPIIVHKPDLTVENKTNNAPLGSQLNPIRIIQQGNNFVPLQNLLPDQLQQIIQAIHEETIKTQNKQNIVSEQPNIIFNPPNQNNIVYRVIYPKKTQFPNIQKYAKVQPKNKAFGKNKSKIKYLIGRKNTNSTDLAEKVNKEKIKKHRPRTRYGRVSKPPQYMIKDYKHIHPVDYEEDYDDSDGGYSDFNESSHEDGDDTSRMKTKKIKTDLFFNNALKNRNHKCEVCGKAYIGLGGLNRHLRIHPDHGEITEETEEDGNALNAKGKLNESEEINVDADLQTNSQLDCHLECQDVQSTSVEENAPNDDAENLLFNTEQMNDINEEEHTPSQLIPKKSKKLKRGRPPQPSSSVKRRQKILEMIRKCSINEILDVMVGYLARDTNFRLMKVCIPLIRAKNCLLKKKNIDPKLLLLEFEHFCTDISNYLSLHLSQEQSFAPNQDSVVIKDEHMASVLGLPGCGTFWFHVDDSKSASPKYDENSLMNYNSIKSEPFESDIEEGEKRKNKDSDELNPKKRFCHMNNLKTENNFTNNIAEVEDGDMQMNDGENNVLGFVQAGGTNQHAEAMADLQEELLESNNNDNTNEIFFNDHLTDQVSETNLSEKVNTQQLDSVEENESFDIGSSNNIEASGSSVMMDDNEHGFQHFYDAILEPEKLKSSSTDYKIHNEFDTNLDDLKAFLPTSQMDSFSCASSLNSNIFASLSTTISQKISVHSYQENMQSKVDSMDGAVLMTVDSTSVLSQIQDDAINPIENMSTDGFILGSQNTCITDAELLDINSQKYSMIENETEDDARVEPNDKQVVVVVAEDGTIQIHGDVSEEMTLDIVNQCLNPNP